MGLFALCKLYSNCQDHIILLDTQERRETYAMLSASVAQAPTALIIFTSSAWLNDKNEKYMRKSG